MEYRDKDFSGQVIILDGNTFTGCTFRDCTIVFQANGKPITIGTNHFKENINWIFQGAAAQTLEFLAAFYKGTDEGGRQLVERTFDNIRRGKL